jgi:hypothetical protein
MNGCVALCHLVRLGPMGVVEFAPEPTKNPASSTGFQPAILGFPKRRGGDSNPRYTLPCTTVFETAALNQLCHLSAESTLVQARVVTQPGQAHRGL